MPQLNDLLALFTGHWKNILPESQNNALLLLAVALIILFFPRWPGRLFRPLENAGIGLANRRWLAIGLCGILALAINIAIAFWGRWPLPAVHDEFSYLLAADTFAHGRFTNPAHPMWMHFETFHVIQQPTYASKYPPGQGLMLAAGQIVSGSPVVGLWLGTALACMSICWMLQQWFSPRWALLGGVLAAVHPAMIYWTQSFWGCQPAIIGGALMLGGLRRFLDSGEPVAPPRHSSAPVPSAPGAWAVGTGGALLLLTRPSEGGVLVFSILLTMAIAAFQNRRKSLRPGSAAPAGNKHPRPWSSLAVIAGILGATIFAQGLSNLQVTQNPLKLPYTQHEETYGISPLFIWQPFKAEPHYNHPLLRRAHVLEEPPAYLHHRTPEILLQIAGDKMIRLIFVHSQSPVLFFALLFLPSVLARDRRLWLIAGYVFAFILVIQAEVWLLPHYATPIMAAVFLLGIQCIRRMRAWRWHNKPCGLCAVRLITALSILSVFSSAAAIARPDSEGIIYEQTGIRKFAVQRQRIENELTSLPGRHLVLVHYRNHHNNAFEWVYNRADIDSAKVVWARAMNPAQDAKVIEYFRRQGRNVWRIDADSVEVQLQPMSK